MKKIRGKKRYFRNLKKHIDNEISNLDFDSWFCIRHMHLDFFSIGDYNNKIRREHIKLNLYLLEKLFDKIKFREKPYQIWFYICRYDSGSDTVYLHTENPYRSFPIKIDNLTKTSQLPNLFSDLIDLEKYDVYNGFNNSIEDYYILSKTQGLKL